MRATVADCLRVQTFATPKLRKFRNLLLCTPLASEKSSFRLLSIQSEVKAFMNCAAPVELAIPPSLRYIGSGAFLDCTAFKRLAKTGRHKWRGVYAEENAFVVCPAMRCHPGCLTVTHWESGRTPQRESRVGQKSYQAKSHSELRIIAKKQAFLQSILPKEVLSMRTMAPGALASSTHFRTRCECE